MMVNPCLHTHLVLIVNLFTCILLGNFLSHSDVINTTAHHTVHHLYFNYNYGQYFTFWDKLGGSHRQPTAEQYDASLRNNKSVWAAQTKEADTIERDDENKARKYAH
jgi:lathosterol oxidase